MAAPNGANSPVETKVAALTITGPEPIVADLARAAAGTSKPDRWISPEHLLTGLVALVSIVMTGGVSYCTESSARHDQLALTETVAARQLETMTFDSLYWNIGRELRAISDRRNTMIGRYHDLDSSSLAGRIAESNRIDDAWRDEEALWDLRVRRSADSLATARWDSALAALHPYGACVEDQYRRWGADNFRYRPPTTCQVDSTNAKRQLDAFRDAAAGAYRAGLPPSPRQ